MDNETNEYPYVIEITREFGMTDGEYLRYADMIKGYCYTQSMECLTEGMYPTAIDDGVTRVEETAKVKLKNELDFNRVEAFILGYLVSFNTNKND